jgi:two-component system response regulator YesN
MIRFSESQIVLIIAQKSKMDYKKLKSQIGIIRFELNEVLNRPVNGSIGLIHNNIDGIHKSYEESRIALNYEVIKGLDSIIFYDEIRDIEGTLPKIEEADFKRLEKYIDLMDDKGCASVVEDIFAKIGEKSNINPLDLQLLSLNLILLGVRKMPYMQYQLNEFLGKNILSLESVSNFKTIKQLKNWVINILKSMNELALKQNMPEKRDVVEEVKAYITKNFDKNITLAEISEKFFINHYYFSQLFKKKNGDTYQNYITNLRITRAMTLLDETDLKIYEVCEMVGYSDTNHFSKLFKRIVGVKPSEYKNR